MYRCFRSEMVANVPLNCGTSRGHCRSGKETTQSNPCTWSLPRVGTWAHKFSVSVSLRKGILRNIWMVFFRDL